MNTTLSETKTKAIEICTEMGHTLDEFIKTSPFYDIWMATCTKCGKQVRIVFTVGGDISGEAAFRKCRTKHKYKNAKNK